MWHRLRNCNKTSANWVKQLIQSGFYRNLCKYTFTPSIEIIGSYWYWIMEFISFFRELHSPVKTVKAISFLRREQQKAVRPSKNWYIKKINKNALSESYMNFTHSHAHAAPGDYLRLHLPRKLPDSSQEKLQPCGLLVWVDSELAELKCGHFWKAIMQILNRI